MKINKLALIVLILIAASVGARAEDVAPRAPQVAFQIAQELTRRYPQARVELTGDLVAVRGAVPESADRVSLLSENGRGEATFAVVNAQSTSEVRVSFHAWMNIRVASRRIMPGEALAENAFTQKEVDLSQGQPFAFRGVILPSAESLDRLESRQTLMEGQFLVQNAVQRIPDLKRGDWVKVELRAGDLKLSTTANAAEPGFTRSLVKVVTLKSKRELAGTLRADGVVEVKL